MTEQLRGYATETRTQTQIHNATYCHNKISEIIDLLLDKPMLLHSGIERITIEPRYAKKSTEAYEKSEKCAKTGPKTTGEPIHPIAPFSPSTIITEQGIKITFGEKGKPAFSVGPI